MSIEARPLAGDYGFDLFDFYPKDDAGQERMQLVEIKNGWLAMMAITGFAYQELFTNSGVIHSIPFFSRRCEPNQQCYTRVVLLNFTK